MVVIWTIKRGADPTSGLPNRSLFNLCPFAISRESKNAKFSTDLPIEIKRIFQKASTCFNYIKHYWYKRELKRFTIPIKNLRKSFKIRTSSTLKIGREKAEKPSSIYYPSIFDPY